MLWFEPDTQQGHPRLCGSATSVGTRSRSDSRLWRWGPVSRCASETVSAARKLGTDAHMAIVRGSILLRRTRTIAMCAPAHRARFFLHCRTHDERCKV